MTGRAEVRTFVGYVKTAEEVAAIQAQLSDSRYESEGITVYFRTDPDFIREVLPPCFQAPSEPLAFAQLGVSRSPRYEYGAASVYVMARYGEIEGWYHLMLMMTGDMPVIIGRELWGEAKKLGEVDFQVDLPRVHGSVTRNGVTLMQISGEFGEDLGPRESLPYHGLNIKGFLNGAATALEYDPIVLARRAVDEFRTYREGTGELKLFGSDEDPCGTVPVLETTLVNYGSFMTKVEPAGQFVVPNDPAYVPYFLGRCYDLTRKFDLSEPHSLDEVVG